MTEQVTTLAPEQPRIRQIGMADLGRSLSRGWRDYLSKPSHVAVLGIIYPLLGLILCWWAFGNAFLPLIFPLVSGFALLGPFAALIYYELSRRMEMGKRPSWVGAMRAFRSASLGAIMIMALILAAIFVIWLWAALMIYDAIMPAAPATISEFTKLVFGTPEGLRLIWVGCVVGAIFAAVTFTISVVSFPFLLDHRTNVATAIATSVRAVLANPVPMLSWGLIVVAMLILGAIPLLTGLAVIVPVLGHSTWHLYRAVVEH